MENHDPLKIRELLDPQRTLEDFDHAVRYFDNFLNALKEEKPSQLRDRMHHSRSQRESFTYWYTLRLARDALQSLMDGPFALSPDTYLEDVVQKLGTPGLLEEVQQEWGTKVEQYAVTYPCAPHTILRHTREILRDLVAQLRAPKEDAHDTLVQRDEVA
ncbi:hypothetical protein COU80_04145 [Candidatus Peregrinibacteria bacterium CG10_big_fil_rev_8_21_14_0_10_55_24]|nr:MAG: hypothetical protein COU80_04145 [Candidatus Peregrinibacteria bacterium CG10_big_fil_rev_8_21_14_0_10_55_24]